AGAASGRAVPSGATCAISSGPIVREPLNSPGGGLFVGAADAVACCALGVCRGDDAADDIVIVSGDTDAKKLTRTTIRARRRARGRRAGLELAGCGRGAVNEKRIGLRPFPALSTIERARPEA